jgi:hypothetical protein
MRNPRRSEEKRREEVSRKGAKVAKKIKRIPILFLGGYPRTISLVPGL